MKVFLSNVHGSLGKLRLLCWYISGYACIALPLLFGVRGDDVCPV